METSKTTGEGDFIMQRILVLCDDLWHPAEVIEEGLKGFETENYCFDVVKAAKDILTWEMIKGYPVILCCKGNNIIASNGEPWFEETVTEVGPAEFQRYIEEGGGFVAVHSALTFKQEFCNPDERFQKPCEEFRELIGCRFYGHPLRCMTEVKVSDPAHPVAAGVSGFAERDEHYQIGELEPDAKVFLESVSVPGGVQPAGYTRELGAGRLCVLTPGHTLSVWRNPEFRKLLKNALEWSMRKEN